VAGASIKEVDEDEEDEDKDERRMTECVLGSQTCITGSLNSSMYSYKKGRRSSSRSAEPTCLNANHNKRQSQSPLRGKWTRRWLYRPRMTNLSPKACTRTIEGKTLFHRRERSSGKIELQTTKS
jgi:hypothetical protein